METFQVCILEKFGVSSVILPYFGYAHQSFLLLSRLSQGSRAMLNDFYREMVNWLFEWNMRILIPDRNIKMLYLPSDMFKYSIDLKNEVLFQEFIEFLTMIDQHKGYYFNEHYMHERLRILSVYIRSDMIQKLVPHFDILKSIKVIDERYWTSSDFNFSSCRITPKFEHDSDVIMMSLSWFFF